MRSMTPAHSLYDLTGLAAKDRDATCQSMPILVLLPGQERVLGVFLLVGLYCTGPLR